MLLWSYLYGFLLVKRALSLSLMTTQPAIDNEITVPETFSELVATQEARGSMQKYPPSVVVMGLGDSGTRAVKSILETSGLLFCDQTNGEEDNSLTSHSHKFIEALLNASDGEANNREGYIRSAAFSQAVEAEGEGGTKTRDCVRKRYNKKWSDPFPWGYKNPAHFMLLPIIDEVYNRAQRFLAVARDPRDVCSGDNQGQLGSYGAIVLKDGVEDAPHGSKKDRHAVAMRHDCALYWAKVWNASLTHYVPEQLKVVRIEDLVVPSASKLSMSYHVMECVLKHARLYPEPQTVISALEKMHEFTASYMGGHFTTTKNKISVESHFAMRSDKPIIHAMMSMMGYGVREYRLLTPRSAHVCRYGSR